MIYRISISRTPGDWIHIGVSPRLNLAKFGEIIHSCFGESDGRHHAFFMDNEAYSQDDCYYEVGSMLNRDIYDHLQLPTQAQTALSPDIPIELVPIRLTRDYKVGQLDLFEGKKFKYVYNFSSDDVYQCRVLKILAKTCEDDYWEVARES